VFLVHRYPAGIFSGWLLSNYSPDCPSCKDATDLFCAPDPSHGHCTSFVDGNPSCPLALLPLGLSSGGLSDAGGGRCAQTCQQCLGWRGDGSTLFLWVLGCSLVSPVLITLLFPCLRRPDQPDDASPAAPAEDAKPRYGSLPAYVAVDAQNGGHEAELELGVVAVARPVGQQMAISRSNSLGAL
jgi:hypothetical protein